MPALTAAGWKARHCSTHCDRIAVLGPRQSVRFPRRRAISRPRRVFPEPGGITM